MKKFLFLLIAISIMLSLMAKDPNAVVERRDVGSNPNGMPANSNRDPWDNLLQFDVDTPTGQTGLAGMEWDGEYFYATKWSLSNLLFKFDSEGNYIESITVPVTGARDLAFDGEYMYGAAANSTVYCWDPQTGAAVPANNIEVTGQLVRALAYDPLTDTFWSGNWGDPVVNWDRDGNILNTFTIPGDVDLYGLAFDPDDPDGPFIYGHHQTPGCTIIKMDAETYEILETVDVTGQGGTGAIAGGLCYMNDWNPALRTLGALLQGTPDYICVYELGDNAPIDAPGLPDMFTVTPDAGGALSAELGWMNPTETVGGVTLTDLDEMHVYRDGELIHTVNNPVVGGIVNWTDNPAAAGFYNYTVVGFNDAGEGIPAHAYGYIGEDVPSAVTSLTIANEDGNGALSWANPTTGLHGGPFNQPIIGYHLVRSDGEEIEVTGIMTEYLDTSIPEGGYYSYSVQPYNSVGDGGIASTVITWIGDEIGVVFGDPNSTLTSYQDPINFYYRNSLSETIYYADEMQAQGISGGAVTGMVYFSNFITNLPGMPINIWIGETELNDLSGGWIPAGELTQVFGGNLDFLTGEQEIYVEFEEPYISTGLNLVVLVERVMDTTYYTTLDVFHVTASPDYPNRSMHVYSDGTDYDPYNPPATQYYVTFVPNTTLFFNTTGMGSLEGHAYNTNNNEPLEGVLIQLLENRLQTYTDANGHYIFPGLFEGTYEAHATLFAHSEDIETVVIVADETTVQDFSLQPVPQVEVTGRVVGSDYPDIGLANAEITLTGMGVHEGITDDDGYFMIDTVYASNTYQMLVVVEGYEVLIGEAVIGPDNTDLGDIIVNEIAFSAYDVIATQNEDDTIIDLIWHGPSPNAASFWDFEDDDGGFVADMGWEWGIDNTAGAHSGTNIWGTDLNVNNPLYSNDQLVTPEIVIPTDDAVLTFWHYYDMENYYDGGNVKISIDGGNTWEIITPVGGYPEDSCYSNNSGIPNEPCYTGNSNGWVFATFEIGAYQGENVMIKFHFGTDEIGAYPGWFIDDVYIGMPEVDVIDTGNPNFTPLASLTYPNNSRIIENYNLYRLLLGDEENEDEWETISEAIMDTIYTDPTWEFVESDIYKYAVKAVYTNNVLADPAFSNWVARDYYTNASVTVHDFFDNPVEEAQVKFMCQDADPDGNYPEYELLTDATGGVYFPMIWKGNYDIRISKENMATYELEMVPIFDPYTLEVQLTENLNPVTGLGYSVIDDDVSLWWNEPADEALFDFEADDGEFIASMGWAWGTDSMSGAHSGDNVWGTVLNAQYPNSANFELVTPELGIPSDETQLTFWHWYDIESYWDGGNVKISTDGGTSWTILTPVAGYPEDACSTANAGIPGEPAFNGNSGDWTMATFELGDYAGDSVLFKFHFGSDGSVVYQGWYIDDVRIGAPEDGVRDIRILEHYNIYRDEVLLADDVTELEYTDFDVPDGTYIYGIRAQYSSGESEVTEVEVEVYPLNVTGYVTASDTPDTTPFVGVSITLENDMFYWETVTDVNGEFIFANVNGSQTYTITAMYEAYQTWSETLVVTDQDVDYDMITLLEIINPPYDVLAVVNTEDTECDLTWNSPGTWPEYEIIYDDGVFENGTAWYDPGNERSVWFTAQAGPCWVTGGSMHIYDGTWPAGNILVPFTAAVWAYDEATGLPGEMLGSVEVVPEDYNWVPFVFDEPIAIEGSEFFLGYVQGGVYPDCAPIAVDDTLPTVGRSYEKYTTGGGDWVISTYQDFMLRALVMGPTGRQETIGYDNPVVDYCGITPHKGAISLHANNIPQGIQETGNARYMPIHNSDPLAGMFSTQSSMTSHRDRELMGYNIIRGEFGDQANWPFWTVVNAFVEDTTYTDDSWAGLEDGTVYTYGVRSVYTNNNMSDPAFSNWVGKDMYATLEVSLTTNIGDIPAGAEVTLEATQPDPDGNYPEYTAITDDAGECTITGIWKGNYDLKAQLLNFADLEDNIDIMEDVVTYEGMITEMMYPAFDLYVEENHAGNAWLTWHSPAGSLSSLYDFEDNDGEFTGEAGWEWAAGSNSGGAWSGVNCWSTWPGVTYPNSANSALYSPVIDVPSDEAQLVFYHWYDIESYWDGGNVKISTDEGATWTIITPIEGYPEDACSTANAGIPGEPAYNGNSGGWVMASFDLSMYDGEEVMFKFHFGSDGSVVYQGWDIDDVYVGEPEDRGRPISLYTEKESNPFSKALENVSRLERLEGYSLYRGFSEDEENFEDWELIVSGLQDTTYEDTSWPLITEPGIYKYCVRVQYTGGVLSEPSFSNEISFNMYVPVTINVAGNGGDPMNGAEVVLACQDGIHTYEATVSGGSVYWEEVWKGTYDLNITMPGYTPCVMNDMWITDTMTLNIVMDEFILPPSNVEVSDTGLLTWSEPSNDEYVLLLEEGFETWPPADWLFLDEDGDSYGWDDGGALGLIAYEGDGLAYSASYLNTPGPGALTPDNWLISPAIQMDYNGQINYFVCAQDAAWAGEHYGVYVSTTG
ncbi:MAG: immune inhibitor A, partial [Candidatus Cloacimonetes bacterium]|nr:immune inhibitor A [Candidatus Cloacimonadota bacterium]